VSEVVPRRADDEIAGRTALVTGAGNGLGRAIARELAAGDARLILSARRREKLETVAAEIAANQAAPVRVAPVDTADKTASVAALAGILVDEEVSILINSAGVAGPVAPLIDVTVADWDEVFAVNVRGVFLMCRAFLPPMVQRGRGDIINIASVHPAARPYGVTTR
jgi:NAD(P)-dependent dehydrogenase (short-subunit alcohol dehydrogenase family)